MYTSGIATHATTSATALNMLTSLRHNSDACDDAVRVDLDIVQVYLRTSVVFHSIGHTVQSSPIPSLEIVLTPENGPSSPAGTSSPELLLQLLALLRRCLSLSQRDMTKLSPAPWSAESKFTSLKSELDKIQVLHAGDRVLDTEALGNLQSQGAGAGCYVMCLGMIHGSMCHFHNICPESLVSRKVIPHLIKKR